MRRSQAAALTRLAAVAAATVLLTSPGRAVATSPAGDVWSLSGVERTAAGLVVTGTVGHHGPQPATVSLDGGDSAPAGWCSAVQVVDPAAGRVGLARATGTSCALELGRRTLADGQQTAFSITVADPGGSSLDVVLAGHLTATAVPVRGRGPHGADGVWMLTSRTQVMQPRTTAMVPRFTRAGAAVTGQAVDLSTDVLFAFDSDVLGSDAGAALDVAVEQLQAQPSRTVTIVGHTDSVGDAGYNLGLSLRRAETVRAALAARLGPGWTLRASGGGESQPVADETRPQHVTDAEADARVAEAQRLNRRVAVTPG